VRTGPAPGHSAAVIAGSRRALIGRVLRDDDTGIARGVGLQNLDRTIGGTVVNGDQFEVGECLRQDAVNGGNEEPFRVVDRHHHADHRTDRWQAHGRFSSVASKHGRHFASRRVETARSTSSSGTSKGGRLRS